MSTTTSNGAQTSVTVDMRTLKLTNRDMIDFKRATGKSLVEAFEHAETEAWQRDPDFEALAGLTWILVRKENPDFTYDDALDAEIDAPELLKVVGSLDMPSPTEPAPSTAGATTRKKSRS